MSCSCSWRAARPPTGNIRLAYNIARQVDDALPAGSDISLKPIGIRDEYTSLTWLAGTLALNQLQPPRRRDRACSTAIRAAGARCRSRPRAIIGRAARQRPQGGPNATAYFQRAAAYPELFYGQLALERLGRPVPAPTGMPTMLVTDAQRAAFAQRRLVRATRRLGQ